MAKFQYRMIAEKILTDIRKEVLLPGMNVPSSRDLSRIYGVSQITAVHALNFLAKRGVLLHKPGSNYTVSRKMENAGDQYQFLTLLFRHISTDTPEFYGNRIIAGITREAASSSIASLFSVNAAKTIYIHRDSANKSDFTSTLEEALMLPKQNIGFIADYFIPDEILEEIGSQTKLPVVVIGRASKLPHVHSVVMDPIPAYHTMLDILKRMGYNAFVCCEDVHPARYEANQQHQFYQKLVEQENALNIVEFNQVPLVQKKGLLRDALAKFPGKRIAILASSDYISRNIILLLQELNLDVPRQIGVVSFYGTRIATDFSPKLSSISIRPEDLGQVAADLLISRDTKYRVHKIPMEFVFGETI